MIIGVLSDTHGDLRRVETCLSLMPNIEMLLHAGDFYEDAQRISAVSREGRSRDRKLRLHGQGPSEEMLAGLEEDIHNTWPPLPRKRDLSLLVQRSKALGVDVTVFGHTTCQGYSAETGSCS